MSNKDFFMRYASVNGKTFLAAIKHNKRETQKEYGANSNIVALRTSLNYSLHGLDASIEIERYAKSLIALAGISKVRINAVWAVEILFSLPVDWHFKDTKQYFVDCYQWTRKNFEGELLSFDIHLDENAPHAHALIFPLIDGKLQGDKLKGDRKKMYERYNSYYKEVAIHYGFKLPNNQRLNHEDKQSLANEVMKCLKEDSIYNSKIYSWIRDAIFDDPTSIAQLLGITMSTSEKISTRSFVDIKRSKGHGSFIR